MSKYVKQVNKCLLRIQKGDKEGLTDLFQMTANHLKNVARVYLRNRSFCDDVVSDTYVRVLEYIHSFNPKKDGYNWLCAIVKSQAFNCNTNESKYVGMDAVPDHECVENNIIDFIDSDINLSMVSDRLSAMDKIIFYKRFYEGATLEEIGSIVGLTKGAVYKRIQKMTKFVKKIF